jgi:PAS domain S-box-containing protein
MAKRANSLRKFGVDLVGVIPWGTHLCQFYVSKQDLIDILVPYFAEGLRNNEYCMWITSLPLEVAEAKKALIAQVPNLDDYIKNGQLEIISYDNWYLVDSQFGSEKILQKWVEKGKTAIDCGFEGLRLSGNTFWVEHDLWGSFTEYEKAVNSVLKQHKIIALCTYCLNNCTGTDVLDVLRNHIGTLVKHNDRWLMLEDAARRKAVNGALKVSRQKYSTLFQNMASGFVYNKAIYGEKGKPVDYVFLEVNDAFERMTGHKRDEFVGKRVTTLFPGIENDPADWIGVYGKVAASGITARFENYDQALNKWLSVSAFSPEEGYFIATYEDITERKKAEETLKENEARLKKLNHTLRAISNSNQAIMWATDEESFLKEACRIVVEDCGYKMVWVGLAIDDPGKSVVPVAYSGFDKGYLDTLKVTWADLPRGQGPTGRAIRTGQLQFCQSMKNDERFALWREEALKRGYASSISLPLKIDDKVIGALTLYSTESTVYSEKEIQLLLELANDFSHGIKILRIRKEQEQSEAEMAKQAALLDLSPDAIFVRKLDGTITFWSKGAEKNYGWTKEEVIGQNSNKILKTEFSQSYVSILEEIKRTGKWSGELLQTTKEGKQLTLQSFWQAIFDLNGEIVELLESNVDITERKQFEQALERAKADWERTFDSVPDLIAILDDKQRIMRANKAMSQALGAFPENCIGHTCYECVHGQPAPPPFCPHMLAMMDGQEHTAEVHEERLGGDFIVSATPLKDDRGRIIGSVHVARNITLRKQMENKLEEYSKELEHLVDVRTKQLRDSERLAAIGATAGMVGHDIRNPLQAIASSLYLAKTDLDTLPDGKKDILESLLEIEKNIDYINKIVVDLQDFAKPLKPLFGDIDLSVIVQDVIKNRSFPENISVQSSVDSQANCFVADATYVRRVLSNLVNNAVQAMPNGGKLTLTATRENDYAVIRVEDTGMGIPEEAKGKLFTPLFTTKSKGQGFGLAVVKRMSEAMGGCVSFDSQKGKGTTFVVYLPCKH